MHAANLDNLHYIMHALCPLSSLQMTTKFYYKSLTHYRLDLLCAHTNYS